MKIQNINNNNYINYKVNSNLTKKEEINKENKYDVIELKVRDMENMSPQSIKKKVVSQINEETNADKINRIKDSINNKTYSIDVEEIVKRLLK
ncbi:MAG: flagellar biosynthesis anti-sigma factor FlgM [Tissierellia bacterium]|nr:flagellar biosynthesis anti-sigma factor FlgM [Tissierellia bacterium]MDD4437019.1 flagellar biosynthesis anti-sigma factor FlgM [Tissierellia bacterium]